MKPIQHTLMALVVSSALCACSATQTSTTVNATPAEPETNTQNLSVDYQKFTLPNGLTTLVYTDNSVPTVYVGVWYKVGSKDEPEGKSGFAHLFEHLMFQETKHREGEYFLPFDKAGATGMNGTTSLDRTNYYATVPSNALDMALWMESDRMAYLGESITQSLLDEQRDVVKNEKRQGQIRPGSLARERFQANFYPPTHPYAHTTIGSMEDLDKASLEDVKTWFSDYYGASNAVLVLAGDIDLATAKEKVAHYFSDAPTGKPINKLDQWMPEFTDVKRDINYDQVPTVNFIRSWPLPNNDSKDTALMAVVARTLAGSKNTPLTDLLIDEHDLATHVSASVNDNEVSSVFSINVSLKPGVDVADVDALIQQAMQTYFANGPEEDALDALRLSLKISLVRSLERPSAIGTKLIQGEVLHNNPTFFQQQQAWLNATTPSELKALAKKWLDKPYFESQLRPLPRTEKMSAEVDRSAIPEIGEFNGQVHFPDIEQTTLDNGIHLVVANRPRLPVVDISMQFETGTALNPIYGTSVAENAFGLMATGTEKYDASALAKQMDKIGTVIMSSASERQSGVNFGPLKEHLDDAFSLAAEMIRHPIYPQKEIDKIIDRVDPAYDNYERTPINAASAVFGKAMWGDAHRHGHIPTREEEKNLSRETIQAFHDNEIGPNNTTIYLIGDITLDEAVAVVSAHFGDWQPVSHHAIPEVAKAQPQTGKVILVDAPGMVQSSITAGHIVAPYQRELAATEGLMNAALGGSFHSRLNMNLREDKGWAYGFSAGIGSTPSGQRVFSASGTVQADKTAASMVEVKREIHDFVTTAPTTAEELARDKASAIRSIPSAYTSNTAFLNAMINAQVYGTPYRYAEGSIGRLKAVTLEQVRTQATKTYQPDALTWVVVGDLSVIENDVRALGFGDVEVWDVYGNRIR